MHEAQHTAAHTEAVRQAAAAQTQSRRAITDPFQQIEAILSAHQGMTDGDDFAQVVQDAIGGSAGAIPAAPRDDLQHQQQGADGGSPPHPSLPPFPPSISPLGPMPGGHGLSAQMQPVVVGIELGPDQQPGHGMHGIISSAIQQALRGAGAMPTPGAAQTGRSSGSNATTTTTSSSSGPQVQVAVGPTMTLPLGPPPPPPGMGVGNLNSFDPFLPCSSRHLPGSGGQQRPMSVTRRQTTRTVRSAPGSRVSSIPRDARNALQYREGVEQMREMLIRADQPAGGASDTDRGVLNMIQGVMGQVMGAMHGAPGAPPTTIRQFLNTLPDYNYVEGESLITDLLMTLAGHLTFQDMIAIVTSRFGDLSPETIGNLQEPMRRFIREKVLKGATPTEENVKAALLRIADEWFEEIVSLF